MQTKNRDSLGEFSSASYNMFGLMKIKGKGWIASYKYLAAHHMVLFVPKRVDTYFKFKVTQKETP